MGLPHSGIYSRTSTLAVRSAVKLASEPACIEAWRLKLSVKKRMYRYPRTVARNGANNPKRSSLLGCLEAALSRCCCCPPPCSARDKVRSWCREKVLTSTRGWSYKVFSAHKDSCATCPSSPPKTRLKGTNCWQNTQHRRWEWRDKPTKTKSVMWRGFSVFQIPRFPCLSIKYMIRSVATVIARLCYSRKRIRNHVLRPSSVYQITFKQERTSTQRCTRALCSDSLWRLSKLCNPYSTV